MLVFFHVMARASFSATVIALLPLSLAASQESSDVPDSFKIFQQFPFAVAISDSDNDSIFECLTAKRAWIDMDTKTGEYIWLLKGHNDNPKKTIPFYVAEGQSPDTFLFMEGSDDAPAKVGKFYYADYKSCGVLDVPYNGRQCILWAEETMKDELPQECLDQFKKHCGVGIPLYQKDLCAESEVTNW
ncbi:uncharacterized protein LOC119397884 [Rhipicephalus sanguineus]|uniref:uncharacterized protein LOC119397884 n=1 Tax=Rhipicephalus sanguineus TaxID=34632 RepID=UPI00189323A3|nr:uncharacterized protein LOC119397884 [Rhipicephalus sanguineus]